MKNFKLFTIITLLAIFSCWPVTAGSNQNSITDQSNIEKLTRKYLDQIEVRLQEKLAADETPFSDQLRMKMIHLAMKGPMADISSTLDTLGESKSYRENLFFIMPFVRWMSAPFLFPVETESSAPEQKKEINKIFYKIKELQKQGLNVSLDNVGDASLSSADARQYKNYYLTLIKHFAATDIIDELYMSLKLSALSFDLDKALGNGKSAKIKKLEIKNSLKELLQAMTAVPEKQVFIRVDMEEYAYKDLTLQLFKEVVEENASIAKDSKANLRLGVVIQAYLRDSAEDVKDLSRWAKDLRVQVPIRLVKGAYMVHERELAKIEKRKNPVWTAKSSTDANYELISAYMLRNSDSIKPAFATHNIRTQARVMALAESYGLEKTALELQMLYGMGEPIKEIIVNLGYTMREYIPAGSLARGLKYAGRRFHELANGDNALARTMRGDFSVIDSTAPQFAAEDAQDSKKVYELMNPASF